VPKISCSKTTFIQQQQQANIQSVVADGAYDSRDNFQFLHENDIDPAIKVRKNSSIKYGCYAREMAVLQQLSNLDKWKHSMSYGHRWADENCVLINEENIWRTYRIYQGE
jgi:hypothetical protein